MEIDIELDLQVSNALGMLSEDGSFWISVPRRWWDLATLIWWMFIPCLSGCHPTVKND
jgi:hypothetical protein